MASDIDGDGRSDETDRVLEMVGNCLNNLHVDPASCLDEQTQMLFPGYKLIFLGSTNVGKTSLITKFMYNTFDTDQATVGLDVLSKEIHLEEMNKTVKLDLWDTGGQERFHSITSQYMRDTSALIVVYDITDSHSFEQAMDRWIEDSRLHFSDEVVIALVGNKTDLHRHRQVSAEIAEQKAQEMGVMFMETSAKTGHNVNQLFLSISTQLPDTPPERRLGSDNVNVTADVVQRSHHRCCVTQQHHHHHYYYNDMHHGRHHPSAMRRSMPPSSHRHNIFEDNDFCVIDEAYMKSISEESDDDDDPIIIVSEAILRKPPEVDDVYALLKQKSVHWSDIGREFRVDYDYREELRTLIYLSTKDKLERVIYKWVESETIDVTWNALIAILIDLEFMDIVRKVRQFLISPDVIERYSSKQDFYS